MGWGCAGTLSPLCLNSHLAQASTWPVRWAEAEPWRENAHVGQSEEEHGLRTGPGVSITAGRGSSRGARKGLRTSRRVWNTVGEGAALQRGWAGAHKGALRRPGAELCSSASVRWGSLQCKGRAVSGDSCQQTRDSTRGGPGRGAGAVTARQVRPGAARVSFLGMNVNGACARFGSTYTELGMIQRRLAYTMTWE